jgi:hypothetical protein
MTPPIEFEGRSHRSSACSDRAGFMHGAAIDWRDGSPTLLAACFAQRLSSSARLTVPRLRLRSPGGPTKRRATAAYFAL